MNYYENKKEIFTFVKEKGCCLKCCLRFTGVSSSYFIELPKAYRNPVITSKSLGYITDEMELNERKSCVTCLGILQDKIIETSIKQIIEKYQASYSDVKLISCTMTIPVCIFLREHSMQICIANHFSVVKNDLLQSKQNLQSVKDIWKWCAYPKIEAALAIKAGYAACSGFPGCVGCIKCIPSLMIDVFFTHPDDEEECKTLIKKYTDTTGSFNKKKKLVENTFSRKSIEAILNEIKDDQFEDCYSMPPKLSQNVVKIDKIVCTHDSIFIGGRYTKLSRKLCQTPWHINGEKKMETSLQEVIFDCIIKYINAESMKFLSSGREDVDVRMLHNGRPFAVELVDPKTTKISETILANIVTDVNQSKNVKIVSKLKILSKLDLKKLKEGENEKTKNYRALCFYKNKPEIPNLLERLNEIKKLEIVQKTPMRVLHRRPLVSRNRTIYAMRARRLSEFESKVPENYSKVSENIDDLFVLDVKTQAGTYVKEFVHGDFGRTKPSLCDLLQAEVDMVALDVTGINLIWP